MTKISIILPKNFMNTGVTKNNYFIADTNDSANWDTLEFPLPSGNWKIHSQKGKIVTLVKYSPYDGFIKWLND